MDRNIFADRLIKLRLAKGVSARDMSLSIGQSAGYINNIENEINYPSMATFFYICEYLGITPAEFFDTDSQNPQKLNTLLADLKKLDDKQLDTIITLVKELNKR